MSERGAAASLPAPTMKLVGDWKWYLLRWFAWMPRVSAEPQPPEDIPATPPVPAA